MARSSRSCTFQQRGILFSLMTVTRISSIVLLVAVALASPAAASVCDAVCSSRGGAHHSSQPSNQQESSKVGVHQHHKQMQVLTASSNFTGNTLSSLDQKCAPSRTAIWFPREETLRSIANHREASTPIESLVPGSPTSIPSLRIADCCSSPPPSLDHLTSLRI